MTVDVLIIGQGAIASYVAGRLAGEPDIAIRWALVRPGREDAAQDLFGPEVKPITGLDHLEGRPDVALECAGHGAVAAFGPAILRRGIDLGIVSTGAFSELGLAETLEISANEGHAQLTILSGAIGAVDALASAAEGGLDEVVYSGAKPPAAWAGSAAEQACDLAALAQATVFFEGTAREAARSYPKNANVAATVALAGTGLDHTTVRLTADPQAAGNSHRIQASGAFGTMDVTFTGRALPDNPKSSALTAMCAVRFLRNRARSVIL